jgi:hypothetical protein
MQSNQSIPSFFLIGLKFEPRPHASKSGILPLESHIQPICCGYFGDGVTITLFPGRPQIVILPIASQLARITA